MIAREGNFVFEDHHLGNGARLLGSVFKTMNPDSFEGSNCVKGRVQGPKVFLKGAGLALQDGK